MELHIRDVSKTYSSGVQVLKDVTPHTAQRQGVRRKCRSTITVRSLEHCRSLR